MFKAHLVSTNEAQAQRGQDLNDCWAAVALDWVVGLEPGHRTLPAHMLPHQGTEVTHHKRTLLHLGTQEVVRAAQRAKSNWPNQSVLKTVQESHFRHFGNLLHFNLRTFKG